MLYFVFLYVLFEFHKYTYIYLLYYTLHYTLLAADNCVLLVDAAKGIEDRTRKLFEVCRMRALPVFTFCNKMDRPSLSPFEIIDQLEKEFNLECCPMNWPIGRFTCYILHDIWEYVHIRLDLLFTCCMLIV